MATAMTYGTRPNLAVPSPKTYVKNALQTLGVSRRNTGYWSHAIQVLKLLVILIYVVMYIRILVGGIRNFLPLTTQSFLDFTVYFHNLFISAGA